MKAETYTEHAEKYCKTCKIKEKCNGATTQVDGKIKCVATEEKNGEMFNNK